MEAGRVAEAAPGVEVIDPYELGLDELVERGMRWDEMEAELCLRAARQLGATSLIVPAALPVAVADRLRSEGIEIVPDEREFIRRRRSKTRGRDRGGAARPGGRRRRHGGRRASCCATPPTEAACCSRR